MKMKKVSISIVGVGPLMFGARITEEKRPDETHAQLEERSWLQRCNVDSDGDLCFKSAAIHRSLISASKWTSKKLSGNKTYTKRFEGGMIAAMPFFKITNGSDKPLRPDSCTKLTLDVPSDGQRGGKKRVQKFFPIINPGWRCCAEYYVTDEALTVGIIEEHAKTAGLHDGLGSMRIGNAGPNGMFVIDSVEIEDSEF